MTFVFLLGLLAPPPAAADLELTVAGKSTLLRWRIEADGQPATAAWIAYQKSLFVDLDRDGDGRLDRQEASRVPSAAFLRSFLQGDTETETAEASAPFAKLDADNNGQLTAQELADYYQGAALSALVPLIRDLSSHGQRLNDALLARLDRDKDGRLSRAELRRAVESLQALDLDEDEWWTEAEIAPRGQHIPRGETLPAPRWRPTLSRAQPDQELLIRLGRSSSTTLTLPGVNVSIEAAERPENGFDSVRRVYLQEYQAAGGKAVEKKHLEDSEFLRLLHPLADRDGDGKLTAAELHGFLDLHAAGAAALVTLALIDESRGLFDLLDADGNGQLSLRELHGAWARLEKFDRDGDGKLSRAELPRTYRLRFCRGYPRSPRALDRPAPRPLVKQGPTWFRHLDRNADNDVSPREFPGPLETFRRLDRDGDGLISSAEAQARFPDRRRP